MNPINRRHFLRLTSGTAAFAWLELKPSRLAGTPAEGWNPRQPLTSLGVTLKVLPLLMYRLPQRKPLTSWKSWGGIQTEEAVAEEVARIGQELEALARRAGFPVQVLPLVKVNSLEAAHAAHAQNHDVVLVYACTGSGELLRACCSPNRDTVVFVRHRSGPVYYWYEALSVSYLNTNPPTVSLAGSPNPVRLHVEDVVVDDYDELLWRLRALGGVKNLLGTRIVALGGPWGKYAPQAPEYARTQFKLEIVDVSYEDLARRIKEARSDPDRMAQAERSTDTYLALPATTLSTDRVFVRNAFLLYAIFKDLLREHGASAFTVKSCMGTIIPMSETTACLALSLLNDEGPMAFCESDFVIIPPGILLRHLAAKPVFLHNSTFPHQGLVTCAHCTCPRRLDGRHYNPTRILTHYESDYGAAPKVEIPAGQEVCFIDPEYCVGRWVGFKGIVKANPFYEICRSQQDVAIQGHWEKLKAEARDSHWMMVYGDYLKEAGYAARKLGLEWVNLSTES